MKRIWELDALRGVGIWLVVALHLLYDLSAPILLHPVVDAIRRAVGIFFVVLSGLCVTLGRRSIRRGLVVFGCAMGITLVTALLDGWGVTDTIRFGVLHLLGVCMILWPVFRKLPIWALAVLGTVLILLGKWFGGLQVETPWLFPLGLRTATFSSGDYFPLCPHLGWFLLGAVLGRTLYQEKKSLLPQRSGEEPMGFFRWCGRQCLLIYLAHQPVLFAILWMAGKL